MGHQYFLFAHIFILARKETPGLWILMPSIKFLSAGFAGGLEAGLCFIARGYALVIDDFLSR